MSALYSGTMTNLGSTSVASVPTLVESISQVCPVVKCVHSFQLADYSIVAQLAHALE